MAEFKKRIGALWLKGDNFFTGQIEVDESIREKVAEMIRNGEKVPICLQDVQQADGKQRPRYNIVFNDWKKESKETKTYPPTQTQAAQKFDDDIPF